MIRLETEKCPSGADFVHPFRIRLMGFEQPSDGCAVAAWCSSQPCHGPATTNDREIGVFVLDCVEQIGKVAGCVGCTDLRHENQTI